MSTPVSSVRSSTLLLWLTLRYIFEVSWRSQCQSEEAKSFRNGQSRWQNVTEDHLDEITLYTGAGIRKQGARPCRQRCCQGLAFSQAQAENKCSHNEEVPAMIWKTNGSTVYLSKRTNMRENTTLRVIFYHFSKISLNLMDKSSEQGPDLSNTYQRKRSGFWSWIIDPFPM